MADTHTIRLEEAVEEIEQEVSQIKQEAREADKGSEEWNALDAEFKTLSGRLSALEKARDNWGSGDFVVKEMTYGELMRARDEVTQKSIDASGRQNLQNTVPRGGFYKVKVLRLAIVDSPAAAPDDPKDYPYHVGKCLYDKIDALNTAGDEEMGNCSLEEAIEEN